MKKNLLALILAGTMTMSLVACGSNAAESTDQPVSEEATAETSEEATAETSEEATEEIADEATAETAEVPAEDNTEDSSDSLNIDASDVAPTIDITGCDTFTQIIDEKLEEGMGYANATVLNADLLLVSSGTFDDLEGHMAAIDATAFEYAEDGIREVGKICSGGTANPLMIKDGYLYSGGHHWVGKYVVSDDKLTLMEGAFVTYDDAGNETYHYESEDGGDYSNMDSAEAEKLYNELYDEMINGEVIDFQPVTK